MTKENAIEILTGITNNNFYGGEVQTACRMGIEALSTPSLPSDLDEAAEEYAENAAYGEPDRVFAAAMIGFRAGAEWMAGQGIAKECVVKPVIICNIYGESVFTAEGLSWMEKECDTVSGDTVIVQIRKK